MSEKINQEKLPVYLQKGSIWKSEAAYWNWIRGQLRRASSRYPIKNAFIYDNRFRVVDGCFKNGKEKEAWGGECNKCKQIFKTGQLAVDHITPAGSLLRPEHLESYITRLFCSYENFQFLCKDCHEIKSYQDNLKLKGVEVTEEDSKRAKEWIKTKDIKTEELKKIMIKKGALTENLANKKTRDAWLKDHYKIWW